jgi:hypothetical protein
MVRSNYGSALSTNVPAASSFDSAQSKNAKVLDTSGCPRRCTTVYLSRRADCYSRAHSSVPAADRSDSRSQSFRLCSTMARKTAGCC